MNILNFSPYDTVALVCGSRDSEVMLCCNKPLLLFVPGYAYTITIIKSCAKVIFTSIIVMSLLIYLHTL